MFVCRQSATTTTGGCVDDIYITRAVVWARLICICMICIVSSYRHMHKLQLLPWMGPRPLFSTWWRHQMEAFSALLRPVTRSFDIFFALHLNKRLSKQSRVWWFETPSLSLWSHCSVNGHVLSLDLGAARFEVNPTCRYFFRKPKAQVWCTVWTARTCSQYRGSPKYPSLNTRRSTTCVSSCSNRWFDSTPELLILVKILSLSVLILCHEQLQTGGVIGLHAGIMLRQQSDGRSDDICITRAVA